MLEPRRLGEPCGAVRRHGEASETHHRRVERKRETSPDGAMRAHRPGGDVGVPCAAVLRRPPFQSARRLARLRKSLQRPARIRPMASAPIDREPDRPIGGRRDGDRRIVRVRHPVLDETGPPAIRRGTADSRRQPARSASATRETEAAERAASAVRADKFVIDGCPRRSAMRRRTTSASGEPPPTKEQNERGSARQAHGIERAAIRVPPSRAARQTSA